MTNFLQVVGFDPLVLETDGVSTKANVGLGNVDNTSDASKPVSTAQQAALDAKISAPAVPADGQLVAWSATLGAWTAANASGSARLAQATNTTGTVTSASAAAGGGVGASNDISGCVITVPSSAGRPVRLRFGFHFTQTVAGNGLLLCGFREVGGAAITYGVPRHLPNVAAIPGGFDSIEGSFDLGVVTTARTFQLTVLVWSVGGVTPVVQTTNNTGNISFIYAVAE